jgi:hypothetical protein
MGIQTSDVQVGGVYMTTTNQERKVTEINADDRVRFDVRSANGSTWSPGSPLASPATMERFVDACDRVVSLPKPAHD